jgi:two-component system, NtrC family, response regulator PilR
MSSARTSLPVLFVEDNEALRQTLATMLRRFGIKVEVADSFASARDFLERNEIGGLITDNQLGDGSGLDLAEFALLQNPLARIGIVSGYSPDLPAAMRDRVTLLQKPFSQDELRAFLEDFPRPAEFD